MNDVIHRTARFVYTNCDAQLQPLASPQIPLPWDPNSQPRQAFFFKVFTFWSVLLQPLTYLTDRPPRRYPTCHHKPKCSGTLHVVLQSGPFRPKSYQDCSLPPNYHATLASITSIVFDLTYIGRHKTIARTQSETAPIAQPSVHCADIGS